MFAGMKDVSSPPLVKRTEWEITYPHKQAAGEVLEGEKRAEMFEGLARSFMAASMLIREDAQVEIAGIRLRDYYKKHILLATTDTSSREYAFSFWEMQERVGKGDMGRCYQQTVETCALCIGLWACREDIWDTYSKEEKDQIAAFLRGYGEGATAPQNWRLFNMLDLAFLYQMGYEVNEDILYDHVRAILGYYAGDGWYRDGHSFDYYSCWAFQVYTPLFCQWYAYEKLPDVAREMERIGELFIRTYPRIFDAQGRTLLWGRSCIYRNASTSPLAAYFFYRGSGWEEGKREKARAEGEKVRREAGQRREQAVAQEEKEAAGYALSPGYARYITSASLLQFFGREDFLSDGAPSLGFYGPFPPLVQSYSCAESPLWLSKAFFCLLLPKDHPFWTAKEERGEWEKLEKGEAKESAVSGTVLETFLPGPALAISNHGANGATLLRTGKVWKKKGDLGGLDNYGKLCYHSKLPWEATDLTFCIDPISSCQYVYSHPRDGILTPNVILFAGQREGVFYRRAFFGFTMEEEMHWMPKINLADFPVSLGILRVDQLCLCKYPATLTLGSFGLPMEEEGSVELVDNKDGPGRALIIEASEGGVKRSLCMTIFAGWERILISTQKNKNPVSPSSVLAYAITKREGIYDGAAPSVLISQVITKEGEEGFSPEEIFPLSAIRYEDQRGTGAYGQIELQCKDGRVMRVDYRGMEGMLSL
ncbi:MAG: DUF2264 domain-containing protein, partial [Blautia sp.]|nr:DUF2264 domain-containing protein [Blautia sp.]